MNLTDADLERARKLAAARTARHKGDPAQQLLTTGGDHDLVGILCEIAFAKLYGLRANETLGNDKGIDFTTSKCSIDVKGFRKAVNLLVYPHSLKAGADTFVLAQFVEPLTVHFLGWATREELLAAPCKPFSGKPSHYLHNSRLRSMNALDAHAGIQAAHQEVRLNTIDNLPKFGACCGVRIDRTSCPCLLEAGHAGWHTSGTRTWLGP